MGWGGIVSETGGNWGMMERRRMLLMDSLKEFTVTGNPAVFNTNIVKPLKSLIMPFYPVQSGTGDPSPSNIRPITGWTGANVSRTGKNLFNKATLTEGRFVVPNRIVNGEIVNPSTNNNYGYSTLIPVKPSTKYYMSGYAGSGFYTLCGCDANKNGITTWYGGASQTQAFVTTIPSNCYYVLINIPLSQKDSVIFAESETAIDFEPFGNTYPITWQTEAGTVYGGTVDAVTGKLIVTDAEIASYNGETLPSTWISDRDVYADGTTPTIGAQVVYKLTEPLEYDISSITINPLLGDNTIFSDTNGINTITYLKR